MVSGKRGEAAIFLAALLAIAWAAEGAASAGARIGSVSIRQSSVFDEKIPGESKPPYTWANAVHILTREKIIRRELLAGPGDPYDEYLIEQSERNLRAYDFVKDARIRERRRGDRVDLEVAVQDAWTTDIAPSFKRSGGRTGWSLFLRERNLGGHGRALSMGYSHGFERQGRSVVYSDPRVGGSRFSLGLEHTNFNDGFATVATVERPLYSLLTPYFLKASWRHFSLLHHVYELGQETALFQKETRQVEVLGGRSLAATNRRALRLALGFDGVGERFESSGTVSSGTLPPERQRSLPKVLLRFTESDFVKEDYINQFERVEDFNLGLDLSVDLGYSSRRLGSTLDEWVAALTASRGLRFGPGRFCIFKGNAAFRRSQAGTRQALHSLAANYYHKGFLAKRNTLVAHGEAAAGFLLDPESQLLLGGSNGLRGYKVFAFSGNRSILVNAESRFHIVDDWLHLVSIGANVFWDAGFVWPAGAPIGPRDLRHDAGMGVRFGFTRSATNPTLRLEWARALNANDLARRWVFTLSTSLAFGQETNALSKFDLE